MEQSTREIVNATTNNDFKNSLDNVNNYCDPMLLFFYSYKNHKSLCTNPESSRTVPMHLQKLIITIMQ